MHLEVIRLEPSQHRCIRQGAELLPLLQIGDHRWDVAKELHQLQFARRGDLLQGRGFQQLSWQAVHM